MQLSPEYCHVRAIFDKPARNLTLQKHPSYVLSYFSVGLLRYLIMFTGSHHDDRYHLIFKPAEIYGTDDEKRKYLSQLAGRDLTEDEAVDMELQLLGRRTFSLTETGRAGEVFGVVLEMIRKFVDEYHPRELTFSASGKSRVKLYKKMIERYLPNGHVEVLGGPYSAEFTITFPSTES